MKANKSSMLILAALVLGILVGYVCNQAAPTPEAAKEIAGYFGIITDIFLRLIKMIIAPLVFATLVSGLANIGDSSTVGRIGTKALGWFIGASLVSLTIGLVFANLLQPGHALNMALPEAGTATNLKTGALNLKDFITHVFPKSIVEAMAGNSVLQILVFSVFFGLALGNLHSTAARSLVQTMDEVVHVMLKVTDYVMRFAPLGVFAAVLPMFHLPEAGLLLIMGIDHFLDMGRTATNVLGNAIATAAVAKWEEAIDPVDPRLDDADEALPVAGEVVSANGTA